MIQRTRFGFDGLRQRLAACTTLFALALGLTHIPWQSNALAAEQNATPESLTDALIKLNSQYGKAVAELKPAALARLQNIAAIRNQRLQELIESDPGAVLRAALPGGLHAGFPAAVRPQIEEEVELDGEIEIFHEDRPRRSRFIYRLKAFDGDYSLHFKKHPPTHLRTGARVRVRGVRVSGALALDSGSTSVQALVTPVSNTFGEQRTLVILVNFRNNTAKPYTVNHADNLVFNTTNNFFLENSYQQTFLSGVVRGWYTIDMNSPSTNCDFQQIATKAEAAASNAGVSLANFRRRIYAFPQASGCKWWGLGSVGGNPSRAWINGSLQLAVVAHELGHNLGLYHSHSLDCGNVALDNSCSVGEYGDTMDIMGAASSFHYNAFQKERLGWLGYGASPSITLAQSAGSYSLHPFETVGNQAKALKIYKSTNPNNGRNTHYYAECRRSIGFDGGVSSYPSVLDGFLVHIGEEMSGDSSYLLDMTPQTSSWNDPALAVGQSFSDAVAGITITPEVSCTDTLNGSVAVTFGPAACAHAAPDITLTPAQNQWTKPGRAITYQLTILNNDENCGTGNFNLTHAVPSGWSSTVAKQTLAISAGASKTTELTITAPASATDGLYDFSAAATHATDSSFTDAVAGSIAIVSSLSVNASTDKPNYSRKEYVTITVTVNANGAAVAKAPVTLKIIRPNGTIKRPDAIRTNSNGTATYKYWLAGTVLLGSYQVKANASAAGVGGSASTSFLVQ